MSLDWLDWQSLYSWFGIGILTGVVSFFSCNKAISLAEKNGMIAQPGRRQSHLNATPTGGGLGLIFSIVVILAGLQEAPDRGSTDKISLAIHRAISDIFRTLLRTLQFYVAPADCMWLELNQLYCSLSDSVCRANGGKIPKITRIR